MTKNWRYRVFNFVMEVLDAQPLSQKIYTVIKKLKCAAKLKIAIRFLIKNVGKRTCRYYYSQKNNTLMKRSKVVATKKDVVKIKNVLSNTNLIELCTKNEQIQSGKFKNSQISLFLLLYSWKVPWGEKTQY